MRKLFLSVVFVLSIAAQAYAGNGDLIVDGNLYVNGTPGMLSQYSGTFSVQSGVRELFRVSQSRLTTGGTFTISATRDSFVHTSQWSWSSNHNAPGRGILTQFSSSEYSNVKVYLDVSWYGDVIISVDWGGPQDYALSIQKTAGGPIDVNNYGSDWTNVSPSPGLPIPNYSRVRIVDALNAGFQTANAAFNGEVKVNGLTVTSDAKFKKNLLPINTPLDKVTNLTGLTYEWKTDEYKDKGFPQGRHYGVIAQEIEKVLPEVVKTAADGTKAVAYTEIIPVLIEAIKEQQKKIELLEKKMTEMRK